MHKLLVGIVGAFGGTFSYTYLLHAPRQTAIPASLIAVAGYVVYLLVDAAGCSAIFSYFLATVVISSLCEISARVMRLPSTTFLLSALVPLVPGYTIYSAMLALVENNGMEAASAGLKAVQIVAAIAVGAAVTPVLFRAFYRRTQEMHTRR